MAAVQVALRAKHLYNGDVDGVEVPRRRRPSRRSRSSRAARWRTGRPRPGSAPSRAGSHRRRCRATPVPARLARLPEWDDRRRLRLARPGGAHALPALGRPSTGRRRRTGHGRGAPGAVPTCPVAAGVAPTREVGDQFGPRGAASIRASTFRPRPDARARRRGGPRHVRGVDDGRLREPRDRQGTRGVGTMYAHLSRILACTRGEAVTVRHAGRARRPGGETTGPHLHFEVRVRGAAVDPLPVCAVAYSRG